MYSCKYTLYLKESNDWRNQIWLSGNKRIWRFANFPPFKPDIKPLLNYKKYKIIHIFGCIPFYYGWNRHRWLLYFSLFPQTLLCWSSVRVRLVRPAAETSSEQMKISIKYSWNFPSNYRFTLKMWSDGIRVPSSIRERPVHTAADTSSGENEIVEISINYAWNFPLNL